MSSQSASQPQTYTLKATCHCGLTAQAYTIPSTALPLRSAICSCTSCRHASGQLFATFVVIPREAVEALAPTPPPDRPPHRNADYASSPPPVAARTAQYAFTKNLTTCNCPRCGARVCNLEPGEWEIASGLLDLSALPPGSLDRQCLFVQDTRDGGGALWIGDDANGTAAGHRPPVKHALYRDSPAVDVEALAAETRARISEKEKSGAHAEQEDRVRCRCHCGTIDFYLLRPPASHPIAARRKGPDAPPRWLASLCPCESCRTTTGFELSAYATNVDASCITRADGSHFKFPVLASGATSGPGGDEGDAKLKPMEGLRSYASSKDIVRAWCGSCGATVLYQDLKKKTKSGEQILDICVGLLDAEEGARAESWLEWEGISFLDEALDQTFVTSVVRGLKRDGIDGPVVQRIT